MAANWTQFVAISSLLLIVIIVPFGSAIKCYQCRSTTEPSCSKDLPTTMPQPNDWAYKYIVDCAQANTSNLEPGSPKESKFCRKQVQEIEGETRVIRSCGFVEGDRDCYTTANPPTKTYVCQCKTDLCNSALNVNLATPLAVLAALVMLVRLN